MATAKRTRALIVRKTTAEMYKRNMGTLRSRTSAQAGT